MKPFFHTTDGRLQWLRLAACGYLVGAALTLYSGGHSLRLVGQLLTALGCIVISPYEATPQPGRSKWRSPIYLAGTAAVIAGFGFILDWHFPPAKVFTHPSIIVILTVALLAFTVGTVYWGWQRRLK